MKEKEGKYIDSLMKKYEHLVVSYARRVHGTQCLAFDREDIEQELRIVLHNAIITYSLSYQDFTLGKREKPTPLKIYIMASFKNFTTKLFGRITKEKDVSFSSFETAPYDWGEEDEDIFSSSEMFRETNINPFEGLRGKEILFYRQFLKDGGIEDRQYLKVLCDKFSFSLKKGKEIIQGQRIVVSLQINQH